MKYYFETIPKTKEEIDSFINLISKTKLNIKNKKDLEYLLIWMSNNFTATNIKVEFVKDLWKKTNCYIKNKREYLIDKNLLNNSIEEPKLIFFGKGVDRITEMYYKVMNNKCFTGGNDEVANLLLQNIIINGILDTLSFIYISKKYKNKFKSYNNEKLNKVLRKSFNKVRKKNKRVIKKWRLIVFEFINFLTQRLSNIKEKKSLLIKKLIKVSILNIYVQSASTFKKI